jgi:ATP-dependent protease ClpP protease subunit
VTSPDPQFTPNPKRAVYLQGLIDQQLLYRLTPKIIELQSESTDPITVYIDSPGGIVAHMESLLQLLRISPHAADPCYFITVVTSQAASAAADFLAAGSYALAYRNSTILYHGVRIPGDRVLTVEETLQLAQRLKAGNDSYAMELARQAEFRALFRFIMLRDKFDEVRKERANASMTDLQCLLAIVAEELSPSAMDVLEKATKRHTAYNRLLQYVAAHVKIPTQYKSMARAEAAQIKAIVSFEVSENTKNSEWGFLDDGMNRVADDFFLLHEYIRMFRGPRFRRLCDLFADFLLTPQDQDEIGKLEKEQQPDRIAEKVRPILQPIWSFFVALCHVLQQGENQLNGLDAFWLGLTDDVIGVRGLPSYRVWVERSQQIAKDEQEKAKNEEGAAEAEAAAGA